MQTSLGMTKAESYYLNMNCPQKISSTIMFEKKEKKKNEKKKDSSRLAALSSAWIAVGSGHSGFKLEPDERL